MQLTTDQWLKALEILLPAASALLAAWFGTRIALAKFRGERAFDARLEWHRNLAETAKVLRNRTRAARHFASGGTPPEAALPLIQEFGDLAFKFQELAEQASLYAEPKTIGAIRNVLKVMTQNAQPYGHFEDAATGEQAEQMYRSSIAGLERVYDLLARDLRRLLGLKELDEHKRLDDFPQ